MDAINKSIKQWQAKVIKDPKDFFDRKLNENAESAIEQLKQLKRASKRQRDALKGKK